MASSTSPALVDSSRARVPLRWVVRAVAAFVAAGADVLGRFQLDERLQHELHRLAHEVQVAAGAQRVEQLGQGRLIEGHRGRSPS